MRKHKITLLVAAVLTGTALLALPVSADEEIGGMEEDTTQAETVTSGDYTYTLETDGTATIVGYSGKDTDLTLPGKLDGHVVAKLGDDALESQTSLQSVTIPESMTSIGDACFFGCSSLESFSVESGSISFAVDDSGALLSADGTSFIAYPPAKSGDTYTVPDGVTELWPASFAQTSLTSVSLPSGLLFIDEWAFAYSDIQSVTLPDTVTEIYDYAFAYCTRLTEMTFPASVRSIDAASFAGCANLSSVTFADGLETVEMAAFAGTAMKEVTVPASVSAIGFCAFGYEDDMKTAVSDFVIYGSVGSEAQRYCTVEDSENDYANSFTFQSVLTEDSAASATEDTKLQTAVEEKSPWQQYGKWVLLGVCVAVLLVGGVVLIVGGKKKKDAPESSDKSTEEKQ